jgi:hypothetical protein
VSAPIKPRHHYAGKVAVRRALAMARANQLDVGGFDLLPNGTVRIFDRRTGVAIAARDIGKLERISE